MPVPTGWELNARGKLGPRMMNLGPSMDPRQLAEAAVDLNLKLMRWRAAPALDTARLAATKCLLLGAGEISRVPDNARKSSYTCGVTCRGIPGASSCDCSIVSLAGCVAGADDELLAWPQHMHVIPRLTEAIMKQY